jgi:hypothetical protein
MEYLKVNGIHKQGKIYLYESFDPNRANEFRKLKGRFYKNKKYWVFPSLTLKNIPSSIEEGKKTSTALHIKNSISTNPSDAKTHEAKVEHGKNILVESNTIDDGYQETKENLKPESKTIEEEEYKSQLDDECKTNFCHDKSKENLKPQFKMIEEEEYKSQLDDECKTNFCHEEEYKRQLDDECKTNFCHDESKENLKPELKTIEEEEYKSQLDDECKTNFCHEEEYKRQLDDECNRKYVEEVVFRKNNNKKDSYQTFIKLQKSKIHTDKERVYRYNPEKLFFDYVKIYKLLLE